MKRFLSLILIFVFLFSIVPIDVWANTLSLPVITVEDMDIPTVDAGKSSTVTLNLKAIGNSAYDVVVTPVFTEPFTPNNITNNISVGNIYAGSNKTTPLELDLTTSENALPGNYPVELKFNFYCYTGTSSDSRVSGSFSETIYIRVSGRKTASKLLITKVSTNPEVALPGQDVRLNVLFENKGSNDANNVNVKIEGLNPIDGFYIGQGTDVKFIKRVPGDMVSSLAYDLKASEDIRGGTHELELVFKYGEVEERQRIYLIAEGKPEESEDETSTDKAKLILDKYSFEPQLVKAGENFEMSLSFYNTSSTKTVKNIKIFLTSEAGSSNQESNSSAFTPVNSSNTFYIDSIPPKSRVEKTITMFTIPDAIAKTHTITANFEYEDSDGLEYMGITELIGVPVVQQSKLEIGEIAYMPEAFVGQSTPISLEFYNTGKVTLYNMMVKLEGDFQSENAQYYVGNFSSGSSEYFEGYVIPMEMGTLEGDVVFTYEDSTGQMQEVRKSFTLNVTEMPVFEDPWGGEMPPMEEKSSLLKSKGFWITLILIVAIGGIVFYRKKRKSKELSLDE
jgi:hypothetical protein